MEKEMENEMESVSVFPSLKGRGISSLGRSLKLERGAGHAGF